MAALFGIIATTSVADIDALIPRIQSRLAYRAPDGFRHWRSADCVIGHGALHMDKTAAPTPQPLRLADGRICVIDGFVANFDDLRHRLDIDASISLDDAQLLAMAIDRWGSSVTEHVQGEFALAIWDPGAHRLQLVRDHLGGRPLCYVQTRDMFAFASHALALAGLPGVPAQLRPAGIAATWIDEAVYLDSTVTAFEGISALAPAHDLDWQPGRTATVRRYWRLQPQERRRQMDPSNAVAEFRQVFGDAVTRSMRGSSRTTLMLSGGIDSGAILAARRGFRANGNAEDLLCISAVLDPRVDDPGAQAENANILAMTATHPNKLQFVVPVEMRPDALVSPSDLAEVAWSWMHPADNSVLVASLVCRLAQAHGSRLILDGVDGDNMTSAGLYYMDALVRHGQPITAWHESRMASRVNTYLQGQSPGRMLMRGMAAALEPLPIRQWRHRRSCERRIRALHTHPVIAAELVERADLASRLRWATERKLDASAQQRCDHLAWWLGFSMGGSESIAARYGTEARHPWCDLQVLTYFQQLPVEYLTRDGWTKWVVRKACEEALGTSVAWHSGKRHLGGWLLRQVLQDAAPYLRDLLVDERQSLQPYVRDAVVKECIQLLSYTRLAAGADCDKLLMIVALAGWLRHVQSC